MKLRKPVLLVMAVMFSYIASAQTGAGSKGTNRHKHEEAKSEWSFVVSGDSRNCGNVVVPAIAVGVQKIAPHFIGIWETCGPSIPPMRITRMSLSIVAIQWRRDAYLKDAWDDLIQNQLAVFGSTPVFVGIGNHETTPPKTREQFIVQFSKWLDTPELRQQRQADGQQESSLKAYFHWIHGGVDFIYLDNATHDQFSPEQVSWLEGVIQRAASNPEVHAVVVGMHAALPDSLASGHSMSDWTVGVESGRRVYNDLLGFQQKTKNTCTLWPAIRIFT